MVLATHLALSFRPSPYSDSSCIKASVKGKVVKPTAEMEKLMAGARPVIYEGRARAGAASGEGALGGDK